MHEQHDTAGHARPLPVALMLCCPYALGCDVATLLYARHAQLAGSGGVLLVEWLHEGCVGVSNVMLAVLHVQHDTAGQAERPLPVALMLCFPYALGYVMADLSATSLCMQGMLPFLPPVMHPLSRCDSPSSAPDLLLATLAAALPLQVVGRKYVRLYHPKHTQRLYPHASGMHTNTSQVDLDAVDELAFPEFAGTPFTDVVLQPGDMLYMPPKHWHYVRSLSVSFSVSFWWS